MKNVCIFGGTGFLGRYITQELARSGYRIKVATRMPEAAYDLKPSGNVGQVVPFQCDYKEAESIEAAIKDCDVVINLVGILFEKGKNKFTRVHAELPKVIAEISARHDVKKFIHVSAMGIDESKSKYAASKVEGEKAIKKQFPNVTILRPSVVFGPGDSFFNMFAKLAVLLPALPLIGGGKTKFQPVYVDDIAKAIGVIVNEPNNEYEGQTYALGGPEVVTFKEIYQRLFTQINRKRALISLPWPIAKLQGAVFSLMPKPLLTKDQVVSLETDNIIRNGDKTFKDLGIIPTAMAAVLPDYLSCYKRGGRFCDKNVNKDSKAA